MSTLPYYPAMEGLVIYMGKLLQFFLVPISILKHNYHSLIFQTFWSFYHMALEFLSMVSAKKGTRLHNSILGLKGGESAIKKLIFYSLH